MTVIESRRIRHLIVQLERGEELPGALLRALDEVEARAAWITGVGALESAELVLVDAKSRGYGAVRRVDTPCDVVSFAGSMARHEGAGSLRISATLARETDLGLEVYAGQLVWARAFSLELHVVAFDDVSLVRAADDRTGLARLTSPAGGAAPVVAPAQPLGAAAPLPPADAHAGPPMPIRPMRPQEDVEFYPEPGDMVTHFHFGECVIISSDGERIRLRQDRDGRVREVALTMLRIEPPTTDEATGRRHFKLARKN